jgi:hypothetical protein
MMHETSVIGVSKATSSLFQGYRIMTGLSYFACFA